MTDIGKLMMGLGLLLVVIGGAVWGLGRLGFKGMPGDIQYQTQHVRVYFPIVTCVVASVLLTAILWLWQWLSRR
jgi:hypothetical protein